MENELVRPFIFEEYRICTFPGVRNNYYEISNFGNLRKMEDQRQISKRLDHKGYHRCLMVRPLDSEHKLRKTCMIHQLVSHEFIGPRPEGLITNHCDGIKLNNYDFNLEYTTYSGNNQHAIDNELRKQKGEDNVNNIHSSDKVHYICKLMQEGLSNKDIRDHLDITTKSDPSTQELINNLRCRRGWKHINSMYNY